jgi:hypothetical protein
MELIKKYDCALETASDAESPSRKMVFSMPVASSAWISKRGKLVVLLKARAGVAQLGSFKKRVVTDPMATESKLYPIAHTSHSQYVPSHYIRG